MKVGGIIFPVIGIIAVIVLMKLINKKKK